MAIDHCHNPPDIPEVIHRYVRGLKAHDVDVIAGTVGSNLQFRARGGEFGKTKFLQFLQALYTAFPDWHYEHEPLCGSGDEVAIKWRQSGTHSAPLVLPNRSTIPATGRRVVIPPQFFYYTTKDDKIICIAPEDIPGGAPEGIFEQITGA